MEPISSKNEDEYKPDLEPVKTICRCCLTTEKRVLSITPFVPFFSDLAGIQVSPNSENYAKITYTLIPCIGFVIVRFWLALGLFTKYKHSYFFCCVY